MYFFNLLLSLHWIPTIKSDFKELQNIQEQDKINIQGCKIFGRAF